MQSLSALFLVVFALFSAAPGVRCGITGATTPGLLSAMLSGDEDPGQPRACRASCCAGGGASSEHDSLSRGCCDHVHAPTVVPGVETRVAPPSGSILPATDFDELVATHRTLSASPRRTVAPGGLRLHLFLGVLTI